MMTNNNNALPLDVMGGRIITWNPTVSALHKAHNIYVLLPALLFKGIIEWDVVRVNKLFKLICLSRNITITIHQ